MTKEQHVQQLTKIILGVATLFDNYMEKASKDEHTLDAEYLILQMAQDFEKIVKSVEKECKEL